MPRQSRGTAAPARRPGSLVPLAKPNTPNRQVHSTPGIGSSGINSSKVHTTPQSSLAGPSSSGGSGFFSNIVGTAAGVALGSSVGHAVGSMFTGSSGTQTVEDPSRLNQSVGQYQNQSMNQEENNLCNIRYKDFQNCMDQNQGNLNTCQYYLDQLKACQEAASRY